MDDEIPDGGFSNRPLWKSPRINGVQATVWPGKGESKSPTVTIDKSYKVGDEYKHTNSFFLEDLPNVSAVNHLALVEMARMQEQSRGR